jgi:succinyl-CoA synthetase alpha subunit
VAITGRLKRNFYKDSVAAMRIARTASASAGVQRVSLLMGTPANKDILAQAGLLEPGLAAASPMDMMIVIEGADHAVEPALAQIEDLLDQREPEPSCGAVRAGPRSLALGLERIQGANLAQISVPGPYAGAEALKALRHGLHVFLFSDNVPLAEERALKDLAARKSLLLMGPDCGTALIAGIPLGFANSVRRGSIGLVGASGTGMQELSCRIHALGEGISHGIGTGSRDVSAEIGGTTLLQGLALLARDPGTRIIVIVSKPPAPAVAERAIAAARACGKPVVVLFLGSELAGGGVYAVATLEEAALAALALARGETPGPAAAVPAGAAEIATLTGSQRYLRGLYSGGTYCTEAQLVWKEAGIAAWSNAPVDEAQRLRQCGQSRDHTAIDLGAGGFTTGRPHPMIDFSSRTARLLQEARDPGVAAVVLDVVLGHGAHPDPASELAPAVRAARAIAAREGRNLLVLGFLCGTEADPQGLEAQRESLIAAGMRLLPNSTAAARFAASIVKGRK